jgi:hypothetical protein
MMPKKKVPNRWRVPRGSVPSLLLIERQVQKLPTAEKWQMALRNDHPKAAATIDALANGRVPRVLLVQVLMQLQAGSARFPVSRKDIDDISRLGRKWLDALTYLEASDLAYVLRFASVEPSKVLAGARLQFQTEDLLLQLNNLRARSSKREKFRKNQLLTFLVRRVHWATGKVHDKELDILLGAVVEKWTGIARWRRDHKALWEGPSKLEDDWDRAVRGLPPPDDYHDWRLPPEDDE